MSESRVNPDYGRLTYRRAGSSGLMLPPLSLGCWHNFGGKADRGEMVRMLTGAFELGITHFDLANNYGPPPGSAEEHVGQILATELAGYRDELVIATKAGFRMWPGPYGEWGSKKYLVSSLDQSLRRLKLDYVDIFYHHRPDPDTPLEETIGALELIVRQGKALYAAISNYAGPRLVAADKVAGDLGLSLLVDQVPYSMLRRQPESEVLPITGPRGLGVVAFSPLAQGLLSSKYLADIPAESRAKDPDGFLKENAITPQLQAKLRALNAVAADRGQSLAQMALTWLLRDPRVTTALIGARNLDQIAENVAACEAAPLSDEELARIETILAAE